MRTDTSSPHKERYQATQPRRRAVIPDRFSISKREALRASLGHRWTMSFKLGKKCVKCGQPAFAVELDRCQGRI